MVNKRKKKQGEREKGAHSTTVLFILRHYTHKLVLSLTSQACLYTLVTAI